MRRTRFSYFGSSSFNPSRLSPSSITLPDCSSPAHKAATLRSECALLVSAAATASAFPLQDNDSEQSLAEPRPGRLVLAIWLFSGTETSGRYFTHEILINVRICYEKVLDIGLYRGAGYDDVDCSGSPSRRLFAGGNA